MGDAAERVSDAERDQAVAWLRDHLVRRATVVSESASLDGRDTWRDRAGLRGHVTARPNTDEVGRAGPFGCRGGLTRPCRRQRATLCNERPMSGPVIGLSGDSRRGRRDAVGRSHGASRGDDPRPGGRAVTWRVGIHVGAFHRRRVVCSPATAGGGLCRGAPGRPRRSARHCLGGRRRRSDGPSRRR
jgi:hypothetical protein